MANVRFRGQWFDPGLVDLLKLVLVTLLKIRQTDITKITMSALSIIETFDVIKYIRLRFVSRQVARAIHSLTFH